MSRKGTLRACAIQSEIRLTDSELSHFWSKVRRVGPTKCWLWLGKAESGKGYGHYSFRGRCFLARAIAYAIKTGCLGITVYSTCCNNSCVNPDHLHPAEVPKNLSFADGSREFLFAQTVGQGEFEVDDNGRIWRLKVRRGGFLFPCERVRAEDIYRYLRVTLSIDNKSVGILAHRGVWFCFNGPIPDGFTINHKNGIKHDNRPENLELATHREQRLHAIQVLGVRTPVGSRNGHATMTEETVASILRDFWAGFRVCDLAKKYGKTHQLISKIVHRRMWKHVLPGQDGTNFSGLKGDRA